MSQAGLASTNGMPTPTTYVTNAGNAVPVANILNVLGAGGVTTSGAGNTITVTSIDPSFSGTGNTVGAVTADVITIPLGAVPGVYIFDVKVASFDPTNNIGAGYGIIAAVRTTGAAAVLIPDQAIDEMEETALVPANASVVVNLNTAVIRVTGVAAHTIHWKAVAEYTFIS
jgi:hypothetical protein